jgi:hypothetical protein
MEYLEGAESVDKIHKTLPRGMALKQYFELNFGESYSLFYAKAVKNFVRSVVGYSLLTYLVQVRKLPWRSIMLSGPDSRSMMFCSACLPGLCIVIFVLTTMRADGRVPLVQQSSYYATKPPTVLLTLMRSVHAGERQAQRQHPDRRRGSRPAHRLRLYLGR